MLATEKARFKKEKTGKAKIKYQHGRKKTQLKKMEEIKSGTKNNRRLG